jgi:hypothetical protein
MSRLSFVAITAGRQAGDEMSCPTCGMSQQIRRLERKKAMASVPSEMRLFIDEAEV